MNQERRREAAETEGLSGCSQARTTQAYSLQYVEEAEREQSRRARGSAAAVDVRDSSGQGQARRWDQPVFD